MGHDDHAEHSFQENSANKNLGEKVVLGTLQESDVRLKNLGRPSRKANKNQYSTQDYAEQKTPQTHLFFYSS